jgi:hypothetical protein
MNERSNKLQAIKSDNTRVKVGHSLNFSFGEYDNTVIVLAGEKYLRHKLGLDCDDKAFNLLCDVQEVESINPIHWRELTESEQRAFSEEMEYQAAQDYIEEQQYREAIGFAEGI